MRTLLVLLSLTAGLLAQRFEPKAPSFRFLLEPPQGLPPMPKPVGYEPTEPMFDLGRRLFHDGILSRDRSVSCATCHPQKSGFASPERLPLGIDGQRAVRHAPALWNRGYTTRQRWDGGTETLEAFVLEPIADQREMGHTVAAAVQRLQENDDYRVAFEAAFGKQPDALSLRRALATFVRGIVAGDAPYDRFLAGDVGAMTAEQRHGQWIFESKGGCWKCHTPPLFTDEAFHNTGVGVVDGKAEPGRAKVTGDDSDTGRWKTPTLRGVRLTAPFMHDGSLQTLEDVVAFYARGGNANPHLDRKMKPLELSEKERTSLVAFLRSL